LYPVALAAALIASMLIVNIPVIVAHDPPLSFKTFSFISAAPTTVGVGQDIEIYMWLNTQPPTASGAYGDRWHNYEVQVTKPDGTIETLGPFDSDPIGYAWTLYTPDQVGEYTFQMNFPGQTLMGENLDPNNPIGRDYIGDYFEPSTSQPVIVTVQQEQVQPYPEAPIPDYWERPINAQHRTWWTVSGNWLSAPGAWNMPYPFNKFAKYTRGPESSHILWTKPLTFGGLVGGEFHEHSYHCGNAYEGKWSPPVIIQGRVYYNKYDMDIYYGRPGQYPRAAPQPGVVCVDIRTGEEIWYNPNFRLAFGQIYEYDSPNQHGAFAYLWEINGSTWNCYDAFTGDWIYTIENVPGGTQVLDSNGNILRYQLDLQNHRLILWNSSAIPELLGGPTGTTNWQWRPVGKTVDGQKGFVLNVTVPTNIEGGLNYVLLDENGNPDRILGSSGLGRTGWLNLGTEDYSVWALNLKPGREGELLWKRDYTSTSGATLEMGPASLEDGVFVIRSVESLNYFGYDINTGEKLWGPSEPQTAWDFTVGTNHVIAYAKLFSVGWGGIVYAYDVTTGERLWKYEIADPYYGEAKWAGRYPGIIWFVADGKIYVGTGEHSPDDPKERNSPTVCLDVNTGEELWRIPFYTSHWAENPAIADGIIVYLNTYDNQIYAIGRGKTETTVSAPDTEIPLGSGVLMKGTVTDQSPGAKDTPAISDQYMDEWMKYLYMQFPCPADAEGVPVKLEAVDSNGNTLSIGVATCDATGFYSIEWTPPHEGKYLIIAKFEGSRAYYSSSAETAILVGAAPAPTQPIATEEAPPIISTELAVLIAVIVVAAVSLLGYLFFRKRR